MDLVSIINKSNNKCIQQSIQQSLYLYSISISTDYNKIHGITDGLNCASPAVGSGGLFRRGCTMNDVKMLLEDRGFIWSRRQVS